jgi:hypothetical protein
VSDFFGLTPQYRSILFGQIHDLVYHGGGGFIHSEIYNMPIWLRRFHIHKISEYIEKQNEENRKAQGNEQIGDNNKIQGPNISPSNTYNF